MAAPFASRIAAGAVARVYYGKALIFAVVVDWEAGYFPQMDPKREPKPVAVINGAIKRYWVHNPPTTLTAYLTPAATPYRLGQKRQPIPKPFQFIGTVYSITARQLMLTKGEIVWPS